jgi:hypothetical protein
MGITGTTQDGKLILDQPVSLPDGTRVRVDISPIEGIRRGSPAALLSLAGTLTDEEAEAILKAVEESRRIDPGLWNGEE